MLWLRQDGHLLADKLFKFIFLDENALILIKTSQKCVLKVPINKIQHWFRLWHSSKFTDTYIHHSASINITLGCEYDTVG